MLIAAKDTLDVEDAQIFSAKWYLQILPRFLILEEREWLEPRFHHPEYQVHFP